jgi:S-adenosylmethionine hydrolase
MGRMIVLFTDFGLTGPYVGQLHAVLAREAPGVPVIDLFHDLSPYRVRAAAYLLPAYCQGFPPATVFACVVDPGVGGPRRALMVEADHRWYVGPDNGLFQPLVARAGRAVVHEILWRPPQLSSSFHGRDLFAPVAACLTRGQRPEGRPAQLDSVTGEWPADLSEVVYVDRYGNAMTGLRATMLPSSARLGIGGQRVAHARTFSDAPPGTAFWYSNSNGLVEIAVNQGSAAAQLGVAVGQRVDVLSDGST